MIIGEFDEHFGTPSGSLLRRWCVSKGWVLVWAIGPGNPAPECTSGERKRIHRKANQCCETEARKRMMIT